MLVYTSSIRSNHNLISICIFIPSAVRPVSPKHRLSIFNMRGTPCTLCAHEAETDTEYSAQVLIRRNWQRPSTRLDHKYNTQRCNDCICWISAAINLSRLPSSPMSKTILKLLIEISWADKHKFKLHRNVCFPDFRCTPVSYRIKVS